ncbi:hypothetical protein O3S80_25295 [Streptomyces sp. Lzd4kr]|nr:hypothetical protein [Streptomyces sp. Lzd4kr]
MLAHAFLAAMAAAAGTERGRQNGSYALAPLTVAEIRRLSWHLATPCRRAYGAPATR